MGADTQVGALTECQMGIGISIEPCRMWVVEHVWISIRRPIPERHDVSFSDRHTAEFEVMGRVSPE